MMSEDNILSGPIEDFDSHVESLGIFLFNRLKRRHPDFVQNIDAVTKEELTCGQIVEKSVKLAMLLQKLSLQAGDVIALVCENTIGYIIPMLSALYLNVKINVINPEYSETELKRTFMITTPKVVFCSKLSMNAVLKARSAIDFIREVYYVGKPVDPGVTGLDHALDSMKVDISKFQPEKPLDSDKGDFICLSSGTTGLPKGVHLGYRSFSASFYYLTHPNYANLRQEELTIVVTPFYFLFGLILQMTTIALGSTIIVMNELDPELYLKLIAEYKIRKLLLIPSIFRFLIRTKLIEKYDISSLKDILCGGGPLPKALEEEGVKKLKGVSIRQVYGVTEIGGAASIVKAGLVKPGCVGFLIPCIKGKVADIETHKALGPGCVGELCYKGPMLMRGYYRNPDATKDAFDEDGFYHTGDLGYYDEMGAWYIIDRIKELIKYKDHQVPPVELESLIMTHPKVKDVGVIGIPNETDGQLALAFVVPVDGAKLQDKEIIDYVAERISVQKHLYGGVKFIHEIPKTPTGKIMRRKLFDIFNKEENPMNPSDRKQIII